MSTSCTPRLRYSVALGSAQRCEAAISRCRRDLGCSSGLVTVYAEVDGGQSTSWTTAGVLHAVLPDGSKRRMAVA